MAYCDRIRRRRNFHVMRALYATYMACVISCVQDTASGIINMEHGHCRAPFWCGLSFEEVFTRVFWFGSLQHNLLIGFVVLMYVKGNY
jgi:hypothetical protein